MRDWLALETGYPPADTLVLLCETHYAGLPYQSQVIEVGYWDAQRQVWRWRGGQLSGTVTHWQPLPEPPALRGG